MRAATFFLALSAVVASVSAANINIFRRQYPDCANPCIQNAQTGNCFSDDLNCLCQSSAFINSTTSCIIASCNAADTKTAEAVAQGFWCDVDVDPGVPTHWKHARTQLSVQHRLECVLGRVEPDVCYVPFSGCALAFAFGHSVGRIRTRRERPPRARRPGSRCSHALKTHAGPELPEII
ncbi:hypothetical protein EUX98_g4380 [Antrodiella citrinella]|uniref:CFEM domain-containing protein n=1 Tax=Antrodiella citrinella TaxID=2447956 RepID=A0A4S4MU51_9APHY|nr:hypothetical protein EUX98_g4380 [Antrodiella citrinella]